MAAPPIPTIHISRASIGPLPHQRGPAATVSHRTLSPSTRDPTPSANSAVPVPTTPAARALPQAK
ncbi:hypothetical protein GRF29_1536g1077782 [Pseudopithomyces chartarum]|uniref:Uncharacterized protein n=1 Tax=Pseudopithomyces chartarum TaxID=1892770 RepID=A0AAN6RDR9_9PLEO|nr:hypothetical protein GRF29_1536g1077782 [Pseudopithomyces chartarum]